MKFPVSLLTPEYDHHLLVSRHLESGWWLVVPWEEEMGLGTLDSSPKKLVVYLGTV